MKKLLVILLMSVTFPVLAEEQTLSCTITYLEAGVTRTNLFKFDPIKKTFVSAWYDKKDRIVEYKPEDGAYVNETEMGTDRKTISRIDGSYKEFGILSDKGKVIVRGNCVIAPKNAF